eukprot:COSAG01_NODE_53869_length_336_cov_0.654008_1_plen_79_part_10
MPLKAVDGVSDVGCQVQSHSHTLVAQGSEVGERRAVAGDGALAAIDRAPVPLSGRVLMHNVILSDTVDTSLQGTLVSTP